jgi:hypothetical protein
MYCNRCGAPLTEEAGKSVATEEDYFQKLSVDAPEEVRREIWKEMEQIIKRKISLD